MKSKVALVSGATSGVGLSITRKLLEQGCSVVGTSRHASSCRELSASSRLALVDGDIADERTAQRCVQEASSKFGRVDGLVNNAGTFLAKPFTEYTSQDYEALLGVNLAGFFHLTQHALRVMGPAGSGHIVNIGTSLSAQPIGGVPALCQS